MAYASAYLLNWLAGKIAAEPITISLHTDEPGNDGTSNELSSSSPSNYARKLLAASGWSATLAETDNDADLTIFTPNADAAGDTVTHVGYWFGTNFIGWVALEEPQKTVDGTAFTIDAGTADFVFALAA